jgi:CubicO group peptidase (beta-lactamase class C family)
MRTFAHLVMILICAPTILVLFPMAILGEDHLAASSESVGAYYPPPESAGGWRRCQSDDEVRNLAGFDCKMLDFVGQFHRARSFDGPWVIVVVRHGYLVREWYQSAGPQETLCVMSCTKSVTGIAYGMLLEESRNHKLPHGAKIDLDSPAYDFIPEGYPLTDPRKEKIKLRHLLTMTSGIPGEDRGMFLSVAPGGGEFEVALGKEVNSAGVSAAKLYAEPGEAWDYSDAAFGHLSLIFARVAGMEISEYVKERVFQPIGVENFGWDWEGSGGHIGPHTNVQGGLRISGRDFARLGYLVARGGAWKGEQIVPKWWLDLATASSQKINPSYGYTFWVNTDGMLWPGVPKDAFAFMGYASNRCYVVPSLDLVVVRLGFSPPVWSEGELLPRVVRAIAQ